MKKRGFVRVALGLAFALTCAAQMQPEQQPKLLNFLPFHDSGIYDVGERAGWTVTRATGGETPFGGRRFTYTIRTNNDAVIRSGVLDLSPGFTTIDAKIDEPAMLYAEVVATEFEDAGTPPAQKVVAKYHLGAAVAAWKLKPSVPRPADFDDFWDAKLKALSEVPVNPMLTPTPTEKPGVQLYTVKLDSLGSHVQGYLSKPAREGKFPALVIFQWAGVYALNPDWTTERAAEGWLVFDVDSHDLPPNQGDGVSRNYQAIGNTDRETSYFLNMYLRDTRAIDYIASRPDWDGKTIVAMGTSMGGQQSLATAGLNPKITAVVVNEPAGADSNGDLHGHKAGYPNWPSDNPEVMKTALYFDTVNFAPRIKARVAVAMGFIDTIAPPTGIWIALNQVPGLKEAIPMVESDHNNITPQKQGAWEARYREILREVLASCQFKPDEQWTRRDQ